MRILQYKNKLVEETGYVNHQKVVLLRYIREEDMDKCKCGRAIDREISIVEGCPDWNSDVKAVETLSESK